MSLFDEVKKNLIEWYTVTSEKTSEVARITSRRYDKFGISRDIERQFGELGSLVHSGLKEGRGGEILADQAVLDLVQRIDDLESELRAKDQEIASIKEEYRERKASAAAAGGAETIITDPVLEEGRGESAILLGSDDEDPHADAQGAGPGAVNDDNEGLK